MLVGQMTKSSSYLAQFLSDPEHTVLAFQGLSHLYYKYIDSSFHLYAPAIIMFMVYTDNNS